jgi:uncharacterized protein YbaP (TraB family)
MGLLPIPTFILIIIFIVVVAAVASFIVLAAVASAREKETESGIDGDLGEQVKQQQKEIEELKKDQEQN